MPTMPDDGNPVSREITRRPVDPDDVRRLAAKGLCVIEIAAELGVEPWAISYIKKRDGVAIAPAIRPLRGPCPLWVKNDDRLRTLIDGGATYAAAAVEIGVSKNAAIGRAYRLGMMHSSAPAVVQPRIPRAELPSPGCCLYGYGDIGDAGFHWCGARVEIGRSWCPHHLRRVYVRTQKPAEAA